MGNYLIASPAYALYQKTMQKTFKKEKNLCLKLVKQKCLVKKKKKKSHIWNKLLHGTASHYSQIKTDYYNKHWAVNPS